MGQIGPSSMGQIGLSLRLMVSLYLLFKIVGEGEGNPHFIDRFGGGTGLGQKLQHVSETSRPKKQDLIEGQVHCVHFEGHSVHFDSAITQQMSSVNEGVCHSINGLVFVHRA